MIKMMDTKKLIIMKKNMFNIKYIVLGLFVTLASCVSNDLPEVGDLPDITGPTPFYSVTDVSTSEFDCNDVEQWAKYDFNYEAGSNLAVNGIYYAWTIMDSEGVEFGEDVLINPQLSVLEASIDAEDATVVAIQSQIDKLEFKLPCETDQDKIDVMEAQIADLEVDLAAAEANRTDEVIANIAALNAQIAALPPATLEDQEIVITFPNPGSYTVGLTVTDNLGKSDYTEKIITVIQAVPTIAVPEIGEPGFEDNSLFDGTGDGRDSWRAPSTTTWGSVFQINTKTLGSLPEGTQAAKFPGGGDRVAYQEIEVTPGATYVMTFFNAFDDVVNYGDMNISILKPGTADPAAALLDENIIISKLDTNTDRTVEVFKKTAITFEAGEHESVIIFITNSGVQSRLDAFEIVVKQ